jgi:hypothetical protein
MSGWLATVGLLIPFSFALIWLATALCLSAKVWRDGEQHADVPDPARLLGERIRPHRGDA